MTKAERGRYSTAWRRRWRARRLDQERRGQRTCPARHGSGRCGGILEHEVLRDGTTRTICPKCERRLAGICQDCPRPVEGRVGLALRCKDCKRRVRVRYSETYRVRHPDEYRKQQREMRARRNADPERRAHFLAVKAAWRARNRARMKMYKRKWRLEGRPGGYRSREQYEAYHRAYRERHRVRYREAARQRAAARRAARGPIICACGCGQQVPWDGRFRPAKWLPAHRPYPRGLSAQEVFVKATQAVVRTLHRAAARIQKKLAGVEAMQEELAAINAAIGELQRVSGDEGESDAPAAQQVTCSKGCGRSFERRGIKKHERSCKGRRAAA